MTDTDAWVVTLVNDDESPHCWLADPQAKVASTSFLAACTFLDFGMADTARRLAESIYDTPGQRWVVDPFSMDRREL